MPAHKFEQKKKGGLSNESYGPFCVTVHLEHVYRHSRVQQVGLLMKQSEKAKKIQD